MEERRVKSKLGKVRFCMCIVWNICTFTTPGPTRVSKEPKQENQQRSNIHPWERHIGEPMSPSISSWIHIPFLFFYFCRCNRDLQSFSDHLLTSIFQKDHLSAHEITRSLTWSAVPPCILLHQQQHIWQEHVTEPPWGWLSTCSILPQQHHHCSVSTRWSKNLPVNFRWCSSSRSRLGVLWDLRKEPVQPKAEKAKLFIPRQGKPDKTYKVRVGLYMEKVELNLLTWIQKCSVILFAWTR